MTGHHSGIPHNRYYLAPFGACSCNMIVPSPPRQLAEHLANSCHLFTLVHPDYYSVTVHCNYTHTHTQCTDCIKPYTLSTYTCNKGITIDYKYGNL